MGAIVHAIVNDNHSHEWRYAMDSFAESFPGLVFDKAVVWCDKTVLQARTEELKRHFSDLSAKYVQTFGGTTFEVEGSDSWNDSATKYLLEIGSQFQADKADKDVYFSIASGNQGIRESALILASLFELRIFDRYQRNNTVVSDDFYEIPREQVECVLENNFNSNPNDVYTSYVDARNKQQHKDLCQKLSDVQVLSQLTAPAGPLNYSDRRHTLSASLANQSAVFEQMRDQVIANIALPVGSTILPVKKDGRVKTSSSLWNKVLKKEAEQKKFIENAFDRFSDIAGVRLITSCDMDMNKVVAWISSDASPFEDANMPNTPPVADDKKKLLGYRAVHFDVKFKDQVCDVIPALAPLAGIKCEIQVKTSLSDTWGRLSHLLIYKEKRKTPLTDHDRNKLEKRLKTAAAFLTDIDDALNQICEEFDPRN